MEASIELVGGEPKEVMPGRPVHTLVPVAPTRFRTDGAPAGSFADFEVADGKVKRLKLVQGRRPSVTLQPKP